MIATKSTTRSRRLDFLPIKESFKDEADRRSMQQFHWDEDSDVSDCDLECNVQAADEIIDSAWENTDRGNILLHLTYKQHITKIIFNLFTSGMRVFEVIHMLPSIEQPEESKKVLFFFTTQENINTYIYKQLSNLKSLICCPSWLAAIVTHVSTKC